MAKKQNEEAMGDAMLSPQDIIKEKTARSVKYLDSLPDEQLVSPDHIPEHIRGVLTPWVRDIRSKFDVITDQMDKFDKASPEHGEAARAREGLASALVTAKSQIIEHNKGTSEMKMAIPNINKGTQDANLYTNAVVFGGQSDSITFNDSGKMSFTSVVGEGENNITTFFFDDMKSPLSGKVPLITEPLGSKAYVWKLAENIKQESARGKSFDKDWTYTRIFNNLTDSGPQNTIGMAFTDLAGDNQTKSFAEMYEEGLSDPSYYVHPDTGQQIPPDSTWMKDVGNADVLKKFLGKYITNVMKDVHGPTTNEKTGQIKKPTSQIARDIIAKYSK